MLENIPQPLYKYRAWSDSTYITNDIKNTSEIIQYSRRILTDNEIYFASAEQFNDPFDAALPFRYKDSELTPDNIFLKLYEIGKINHPDWTNNELMNFCYQRQSSGIFESGQYWKDYYPEFINTQRKTFGILSLTKKRDNLLMWSHYSDSHRGFCVGLDKHLLFKHSVTPFLSKVFYEDEFPLISLFNESPIALHVLAITKSKHWEYEEEYRIINLAPRKAVIVPNEAVLEIILGCNMPNQHKDHIYELAKNKFKNAQIFEAKINSEKFQLDMIPIINNK